MLKKKKKAHHYLAVPFALSIVAILSFVSFSILYHDFNLIAERCGVLQPFIAYLSDAKKLAKYRIQILCEKSEGQEDYKHLSIKSLICDARNAKIWYFFDKARSYNQQIIYKLIEWRKKKKRTYPKKSKKKNYVKGYLSRHPSNHREENGLTQKKHYEPIYLHPSIIITLQNEDVQNRRIARACDPKNNEGLSYAEGRTGSQRKDIIEDSPYSGMVLQVLPKSFYNAEFSKYPAHESQHEVATNTHSIELRHTENSITSPGRNIDVNLNIRQPCKEVSTFYQNENSGELKEMTETIQNALNVKEYILLEVMHGSLGRIDFHNSDFAYRPVIAHLGAGGGTDFNRDKSRANSWFWDDRGSESDYERMGKRAFAGGSHGEVWKARRKCNQVEQFEKDYLSTYQKYRETTLKQKPTHHYHESSQNEHKRYFQRATSCDDSEELILKRMKVGEDLTIYEAGLREIYFGDILNRSDDSQELFTTYVDHFFLHHSFMTSRTELWIVFRNAGPSLRSYIYNPVTSGDFVLYQHSALWHRLRLKFASKTEPSKASSSVAVVSDFRESAITFIKPNGSQSTTNMGKHNLKDESNTSLKSEVASLMKDILSQIIRSAAKLHERGIVHR